jgi:hypothetical protein
VNSCKKSEDTKGVLRIGISKNRQHNVKRKSTKGQTTIYKTCTHKTEDQVTRAPLKTGGELDAPEG